MVRKLMKGFLEDSGCCVAHYHVFGWGCSGEDSYLRDLLGCPGRELLSRGFLLLL